MPQITDIYSLGNSIDTFAPGHYARVYEATDKRDGQPCAFKVMRLEHVVDGDAQPRMEAMAFINEAELLIRMAASSNVVRLYDCGYIRSQEENPRVGDLETYGLSVEQFRQGVFRYAGKGWRPYLSLELLPRARSLFYVMRGGAPGARWRLPTEEALDLAYQFTGVLKQAHVQNIVYLDHKLEHVYWDGRTLRIIDWNSSRLVENSASVLTQQVIADIHNLCVGILYPIFTGLSPQKGSLVPQPADQSGVDTRYLDVNQLDFAVEPTISGAIQELLQIGARRQLQTIDQFSTGLNRAALDFGWNSARSPLREARSHARSAMAKLREGHDAIREARDLIREAAIMEEISEEFEAELKRLLNKINEMLNARVIP